MGGGCLDLIDADDEEKSAGDDENPFNDTKILMKNNNSELDNSNNN